MTADGANHSASARRAIEEAHRAATDEWAAFVRPRGPRREHVRQIVVDVVVLLAALLIIVLLS